MGKFSVALEKAGSGGGVDTVVVPQQTRKKFQGSMADPVGKVVGTDDMDSFRQIDRWDARLLLVAEQYSPFAENFRRLRAAILHPAQGVPPKTILITSLAPNEGKGFVCANLGVALAEEIDRHALIVDCDFRRPGLANLFGLSNETGLVDHLQRNVDISLLLRQSGQPKLSLLPSGKPPLNPAELLTSKKLVNLIDEIARRYEDRIILFDSPPTMVASETSTLAQRVDGVILVVRWGVSGKELVKKFVDELGREKIIGVVFNAYEESKVSSFLYETSRYGYNNYYSVEK